MSGTIVPDVAKAFENKNEIATVQGKLRRRQSIPNADFRLLRNTLTTTTNLGTPYPQYTLGRKRAWVSSSIIFQISLREILRVRSPKTAPTPLMVRLFRRRATVRWTRARE